MSVQTPVASALPLQLALLRAYGYETVTVSELLALSPFEDLPPDDQLVSDLAQQTEQGIRLFMENNSNGAERYTNDFCLNAFGVMFYDTRRRFMRPVVWVRDAGPAAPESSCGSGSAAMAVWSARNLPDTDQRLDIDQPGGTIRTRVLKERGEILKLSIGGQVKLSETFRDVI
jgi:hypothetical protein